MQAVESKTRRIKIPWQISITNPGIQALLLVLALVSLLHASPFLYKTPDVDSGIFSYIGKQILEGRIPYKDIWDHNPPLIFYLNAIGLAVGGQGRWGIWLVELVSVWASAWLLFRLLKQNLGILPALFGSAGFLANLFFVLQYGNRPEEYGLLLQCAVYLLLADLLGHAAVHWSKALMVGLLIGLAASLKLTLVGLGLVATISLIAFGVFSKNSHRFLSLAWVGAGFGLVWAGWVIFFAAQGALGEFFDQVFRYNFLFSQVTHLDRINAVQDVIKNLSLKSGFFQLGLLAWLPMLIYLFFNERQFRSVLTSPWIGGIGTAAGILLILNGFMDDHTGRFLSLNALSTYRILMIALGSVTCLGSLLSISGFAKRWERTAFRLTPSVPQKSLLALLGIFLVDMPVQLILSGISGTNHYDHFLPMMPALAVLCAFLIYSLTYHPDQVKTPLEAWVWTAVFLIPLIGIGYFSTVNAIRPSQTPGVQAGVQTIQQMTTPDDQILQWGTEGRLYFISERKAASRYLDSKSLFTPGYFSQERMDAFLSELQRDPPDLVVDVRTKGMPLIVAEVENCEKLVDTEYLKDVLRTERDARDRLAVEEPLMYFPLHIGKIYSWICNHYQPVENSADDLDAWRFYEYTGGQP